jgi:hypothetical protein
MSKCNSVFARDACWAAEGSEYDEHPANAKKPRTAIDEAARFVILCVLEPDLCIIELTPISLGFVL